MSASQRVRLVGLRNLRAVVDCADECVSFLLHVDRYDFNQGVNYDEIMKAYLHMGYQGTNLGEAIEEIKRMVRSSECHCCALRIMLTCCCRFAAQVAAE